MGAIMKFCLNKGLNYKDYIDMAPANNIVKFRDIINWAELFDIARGCLNFLLEEESITADMVIKTTVDILRNAGYTYSKEEVRKQYFLL